MKHTMVLVLWHDAHSVAPGWSPLPFDGTPCIVESVGFLIEDGKPDHVVLAQSYTDSDDYDHVLAIPFGMVKEVAELRCDISRVGFVIKAD